MVQKTSYSFIHDTFLIKGLPVVISDTTTDFNESQSLIGFIDEISEKMAGMIQDEVCNLRTNLMMSKYAKVDAAFSILTKLSESCEDLPPWFVLFRNCQVQAVEYFCFLIESLLTIFYLAQIFEIVDEKTLFLPKQPSSSFVFVGFDVTQLRKLPKRLESLRFDHRDPTQRQFKSCP